MEERVVIERRFNGPPDSGHGGYSCGLVAALIDSPAAAVSLRRPPPLERPLDVRRDEDGAVALLDGSDLVAEGRPAELDLDVPDPVDIEEAEAAAARWPWYDRHPFPTCFACGPERGLGDGMRLFAGPVTGREGLFATPWAPAASHADADGRVPPLFVWAALDCPTAAAVPTDGPPSVLARLTAQPLAPARAGDRYVAVSWLIDRDGRKTRGGCAIFGADGELRGVSEGLWIQQRERAA